MDKEIAEYIKRSECAIKVSEELLGLGHFSDSVSKSYYAMFYAASAVMKTKNIGTSKHSALLSLFNQHFIKDGIIDRHFYKLLVKGFEDRQIADYDIFKVVNRRMAEAKIKDAKEFVNEMKRKLKEGEWL